MDFQRGRRSYRARDEGRETSDVYSSVCRRRTVSSVDERQGVELDETQSTDKGDVSPRNRDADWIGDDNGVKPA